MTTPQPSGGGGSNVWTRKYGPMPLWAWGGVVVLLALGYSLYKKHTAAASSQQTQSNPSVNSPGGVDASLVPQFVNQVYTQGQPPPAPNITVNNQIPTATGPPTTTPPPNQAPHTVHQYPAPQGLKVSNISRTAITASWQNLASPTPVPGSYTVAVYDKAGKVVNQQTVNAPDTIGGKSTVTLTGLPNGQGPFQIHVWANGGALAPPHASTGFKLA